MIKIIFPHKKTVKKVGKILNALLGEKHASETIYNTIWFKGLYLKITSHMIVIDVLNSAFISEKEIKDILKQSLKNERSYILYYTGLYFYIDSKNVNEKFLQVF